MLPVIPHSLNKLLTDSSGQSSTYPFPDNVAELVPKEMRQEIYRWMLSKYIWPQVMERKPHEERWDELLEMSKAAWKYDKLNVSERTRQDRLRKAKETEGLESSDKCDISDTLIFDAVDRLTNLNHFVSFKDKLPVQYEMPEDMVFPMENSVYSPSDALIKAANGWLKFNADNSNFYRNHWMASRHHYTYGVSFVSSEFEQRIGSIMRRQADGSFQNEQELLKIGVTFEPISIRKLWLNYRLTAYQMEYQPCPFFYEVMPRFAIIANPYDKVTQPFGYQNLDSLPNGAYLFGSAETNSFEQALKLVNPEASLTQLTPPELSVELNWVFYPMLPFLDLADDEAVQSLHPKIQDAVVARLKEQSIKSPDGQVPQFLFDDDGSLHLPLKRFIVEAFGIGLNTGLIEITRLQRNFYPHDSLPLYGSAHMPSADEGAYPSAMGDILKCHYIQITKALNQYLDNKDLINDPPTKIHAASPANTKDLNRPGAKIKVNSMKDYEKDTIVDGTQTTPAFLSMVRNQAQTSSKATNAILGEALGSRTSATEASNVFQTAMSGATTDINLFNFDISGGYADRVWEYGGLWVDPDILKAVTGSYGFALTPQQLQIRLGLKWDIGSTYIESITRQQNIRYILETLGNNPSINVAELARLLLKEWKFTDIDKIVNDGGVEDQVKLANLQACMTYMGDMVMVDPDQNHQIAIRVKVSYLKDHDSVWNQKPEFAQYGARLVEQITQHQKFLQLQMLQQQAQAMMLNSGEQSPTSLQSLQIGNGGPSPIKQAGQIAQQQGGRL